MDYRKMAKIFDRIKKRNIKDPSDKYTYAISPYLNDLGYDIFDDDDLIVSTREGLANLFIKEGLWGQITTEEPKFDDLTEKFPELSIIQYIDTENSKITLYFKGLDKWEEASSVEIGLEGYTQDHTEAFDEIKGIFDTNNEFIQKDINNKFLTDFIFRAKISNGEWNNDYLVHAISDELINPSDDMIKVIANNISKNYTTLKQTEVYDCIKNGIRDETLYNIIVEMYGLVPIEDTNFEGEGSMYEEDEGLLEDTEEEIEDGILDLNKII